MWLKKLFGRVFKSGGSAVRDSLRNINPSGLTRTPPMLDPEEDGKVRIVSGGTASETRVLFGGRDITSRVTLIDFRPIEPLGFVSARIAFENVELDVSTDTDGGVMDVMIDGSLESRPVISIDRFYDGNSNESSVNRPLLMPDEEALYFIDGRPPVIVKKLVG